VQSFIARVPLLTATANQRIRIMEKTLEFSSTVLSTLSLYRFLQTEAEINAREVEFWQSTVNFSRLSERVQSGKSTTMIYV